MLPRLFGNHIFHTRVLCPISRWHYRIGLERPCEHSRFSVVEAWIANEPSQPQGWHLLSELPAAIYSNGRPDLVVQHAVGVDSRDRRHSLVSSGNKRD